MKILLVHNFYGSTAPSGENTAYTAEVNLLRNHGHSVAEFTRDSDEILDQGFYGKLKGAAGTVWNPFSLHAFNQTLAEITPDVVHVHNTFPLLSPSIFYASREPRLPIVMTLHNYRIGCSAGTAMRMNRPCTLCLDEKSVLPALHYGCYRDSRLATLPVSAMIAFHTAKNTWQKNVDAFVTLTDFQRQQMVHFGLPEDALFVKPHFLEHPPKPVSWKDREEKAVFIGRLYEAKGIHILIDAWKQWGKDAPHLEVIGDGPMKGELLRSVQKSKVATSVSFVGNVSREEAMKRLATAKLLIVPSLCFEGFPMVVQEAFALGVPVAASNLGSLPLLVDPQRTGGLFESGNAGDLLSCVRDLLRGDKKLQAKAKESRREFEKKYTAEKNYDILMSIYDAAAVRRKNRLH